MFVRDSGMNWLPKIRNLYSMETELIEHSKLIFIFKRHTMQQQELPLSSHKHVESNLLSVTISKLASVVEKRQFRRIKMKRYAF